MLKTQISRGTVFTTGLVVRLIHTMTEWRSLLLLLFHSSACGRPGSPGWASRCWPSWRSITTTDKKTCWTAWSTRRTCCSVAPHATAPTSRPASFRKPQRKHTHTNTHTVIKARGSVPSASILTLTLLSQTISVNWLQLSVNMGLRKALPKLCQGLPILKFIYCI